MSKKIWMAAAGSGVSVVAIALSISFLQKAPFAQGPLFSAVNDTFAMSVAASRKIEVFRSPNCSCCEQWIEHLEAAGFQVKDNITEDLTPVKQRYGVPEDLAACHTATVDGYVVEGHVPAENVQRLLAEKPDITGLAVPGMPIGSPGMEAGDYVEPYTVFSFREDGSTDTFAEHS